MGRAPAGDLIGLRSDRPAGARSGVMTRRFDRPRKPIMLFVPERRLAEA
jgi:hypothetical protein